MLATDTNKTTTGRNEFLERIAVAQFNPVTGDLKGNTERIIRIIEDAKKREAALVVLPELPISGYCLADTLEYDRFILENRRMLDLIAEHCKGVTAVVGFIDYNSEHRNEDGSLRKYNAAAVLSNGTVAGIARKVNLPNYRYFDDKRYFTPGEACTPIEVEIGASKVKLGIVICEDIWDESYKRKPVNELASQGADLIIAVNASPFTAGKFTTRDRIIREHIATARVPFIYANTVGVADNGKNLIPFDGESLVYNGRAELIARGKQFSEETLFVDLRNAEISRPRTSRREEELFDASVMALRDYMKKTGFKTVLVPVSGGIDSALAVAIACEAVGKENVRAFTLPSKFNSETTKGIAHTLMENFASAPQSIPIQRIIDTVVDEYRTHYHASTDKIAGENLHARIRGLLMMYVSNSEGSLLLSCGNKTEIALGYSTLYGDMCGGISAIGDLSKTDVYRVARYVNERAGRAVIPEATFTIKPSAELSEGQFDPFDYAISSPLVDDLVVNRRSPAELIEQFSSKTLNNDLWIPDEQGRTVYDKHTAESFAALVRHHFGLLRRSVYKRLQGAPIIALTESAFGFDRRETIMNAWKGE